MTRVQYDNWSINRDSYRVETTRPYKNGEKEAARRELAQQVFDFLKKAGVLNKNATVDMVLKYIGDKDGDGCLEVDVEGLANDPQIVNALACFGLPVQFIHRLLEGMGDQRLVDYVDEYVLTTPKFSNNEK